MKILFVDTTSEPGSHANRIARLINGLIKQNITVCLFCASPRLYRERLEPGVSIHTIDWEEFASIRSKDSPLYHRSTLGWTRGKRLSKYEKQILPTFADIHSLEEPDLVHILDLDLSLKPFAEFCVQHEIPFVVHASQIEKVEDRVGAHLPSAMRVIVCGEAVKKWLMERFSEAYFRNYEVVPWPVEVGDTRDRPDLDVRDMYKTPPDAKLIVVPGPIDDHRGQQDVMKAFSMIRQDFPIAYLWVAGDLYGNPTSNLPQEAIDQEITDKIRFLGEPQDLQQVYAACDLFVYAPRNAHPDEGPVDAVAECVPQAMAAGLPVVVTDAGGAPDYVLGTQAGSVVPPRSADALADMMRTYLSNDALLSKSREAAYKRAKAGFSSRAVAEKFRALYQQILKS